MIQGVDVFWWNGNLGQEDLGAGVVIGVRVVERNCTFVRIEYVPVSNNYKGNLNNGMDCTHQDAHLTPSLPTNSVSMLGNEPPDRATENLPFLSIDSFCALRMNAARALERRGLEGNV